MIDTYKVSHDLSIVKIDDFFYKMELHEQSNQNTKEKKSIACVTETNKKKM